MPNTETVHLNLTPRETDRVAYVLMTSLRMVSMTDGERADVTATANELFSLLGYSTRTDSQGNRADPVK